MSRTSSVIFVEPPAPPVLSNYPDYRLYLADYSGFFQATRSMSDACGQIIRIRTKHRRKDGSHQYTQRKVLRKPPSALGFIYSPISEADARVLPVDPVSETFFPSFVQDESEGLAKRLHVCDVTQDQIANAVSRANPHNFYSDNDCFHACTKVGMNIADYRAIDAKDDVFNTRLKVYVDYVIANYKHSRVHGTRTKASIVEVSGAKAKVIEFIASYIAPG
jgi:hypothetical protein